MRLLVVALILLLSPSAFAQATVALPRLALPHLELPRLGLDRVAMEGATRVLQDQRAWKLGSGLFDVVPHLAAGTPSITVQPRHGWVLDDGRAFWFAAGASSFVSLGTHVLLGVPTVIVAGATAAAFGNESPSLSVPILLGFAGGYVLAQSALSALASVLVFNGVSKIYEGDFLVAFGAHVAGNVLGSAVTALSFGTGYMLLGGLNGLVEFTGSAGIGSVQVFSLLGALPAVVIGGIALVAVPAIIGAWALSVSAKTKPGFAVDPGWRDPAPVRGAAPPVVTVPIPGS